MLYAFILGTNTALSVAEIISILKRELFVFVILSISSKALIIKTDKKIEEPQGFLDKLGGTIKISEIFIETTRNEVIKPILSYIENSQQDSKFIFGISFYGFNDKNLGFEIKKELKKVKISSRFVQGKETQLSAPEIKNNKILEKGADFVLIKNENKIFLGKTMAIQDYESYSHRDYDRPRRNAKSGMLPPKVAQIMLNLIPSEPNKLKSYLPKKLVYDPFCGQGTVLQEALLLGYQVIGSDISKERVYDTKENLKWLAKEYNLRIKPDNIVFQADALELKEKSLPEKPEAIVSEVYLGPPLIGRETEKEISDTIIKLKEKYEVFLKNLQLISNIQYLILALPFYVTKNKVYSLNIFDSLKEFGYNIIDPFNNTEIDLKLLPEYDRERKSIRYIRDNQIVGREIFILEKNNN